MAEPRFNIGKDKLAPSFNPYGTTYTERQLAILNGDISLDAVRLVELTILLRKAEKLDDGAATELASQLYIQKSNPGEYFPPYTVEEAKAILRELTPWETTTS